MFIRHSAKQKNEQRQRQTDNRLYKTTKKLRKTTQNYTLTQNLHSTLREKRIIYDNDCLYYTEQNSPLVEASCQRAVGQMT